MNPMLLPQHQHLIATSGIAPEVAAARGYRSITTKADARRLGFGDAQCNVPALLIPVWGVTGEVVTYQLRPDTPRVKDGKPLKYETPVGSHMALDIPCDVHAMLGDPAIPLIITEGARKADSAVSQGLCCIALLGVWNWRGRNAHDGKVALPDWEHIALSGRTVRVAFDSDVMEKAAVYAALVRLGAFLRQRGAQVEMIYLPAGPGGAKTGLDDFFSAGRTKEDLWQYATSELRTLPHDPAAETGPYIVQDNRIVFMRRVGNDAKESVALTNFSASVLEEVIADDGASERGELVIAGTLADGTPLPTIRVPLAQFAAMNWPMAGWGMRAVVSAGMGAKDRAREAIQLLSPEVIRRREYAHSGWRRIDGNWAYLHAGGAIGADGSLDDVCVRLGGALARLSLPAPPNGDALHGAVRASLAILAVAPDRITAPLLGAVYRAPLFAVRAADMAAFITGDTGVMKSEIAALAMQHYGPDFDRLHLPAQWVATANALERLAFEAKDALLVIDDFAPHGSQQDIYRLHGTAERVIRGAGNGAGRGRMYADGRLRPDFPPRGLIVGTGEDVPRGQSLRARTAIIEVGRGDVNVNALTSAQHDGAMGEYAAAMAGYIQWLAGRFDALRETAAEEIAGLRDAARTQGAAHARTPDVVAHLAYGWRQWLTFARDVGGVTKAEGDALWERVWAALGTMAVAQAAQHETEEPTRRFLSLIGNALASWEGHLATPDGQSPELPEAWGWRIEERQTPFSETRRVALPQGKRLGWIDGAVIYLLPDAAYAAVNRMATAAGAPFSITQRTLGTRLHERGLLAAKEPHGFTVPRVLEGQRQRVLALHRSSLTSRSSGTSGSDTSASNDDGENAVPDHGAASGTLPDADPVACDDPVATVADVARENTARPDVPDTNADMQRAVITLHNWLVDGTLDRLPDLVPLPDDLAAYGERSRLRQLCRAYLDSYPHNLSAHDGITRLVAVLRPVVAGLAA